MKIYFLWYIFFVLVFAALFSGCSSSQALYSWGDYENQVHAYLNRENPEAQLRVLERSRQNIESSGKKIPPGFYAHIGMIYAELGSHDMAIDSFEKEKTLFPESAVFMDFILDRYRR
ncbi:MAG: DUF4810 domain-containing protein [Treponema sp.]|nr:DUF4810 domain-containing protein [Treponema sp.]